MSHRYRSALVFALAAAMATSASAGVVTKFLSRPGKPVAFLGSAALVAGAAHLAQRHACKKNGGRIGGSAPAVTPDGDLVRGAAGGLRISCPEDVESATVAEYASTASQDAVLATQTFKTRELVKNMKNAGKGSPPEGCAAHHIVPREHKPSWARVTLARAREVLAQCQIDIDDAVNGIYLPHRPDAKCKGADHNKVHNREYYEALLQMLLEGRSEQGCRGVRHALEDMHDLLENTRGRFH